MLHELAEPVVIALLRTDGARHGDDNQSARSCSSSPAEKQIFVAVSRRAVRRQLAGTSAECPWRWLGDALTAGDGRDSQQNLSRLLTETGFGSDCYGGGARYALSRIHPTNDRDGPQVIRRRQSTHLVARPVTNGRLPRLDMTKRSPGANSWMPIGR